MKGNRITIFILLLMQFWTLCGCCVPWQHKRGFQNFITIKEYNDDVGEVINKYLEEKNYKLMEEYNKDNRIINKYKKYMDPSEMSEDNCVVANIYIYNDVNNKSISKVYINIFSMKKGDQELFYNEINMVGDAIYKMSSDIVGNTNVKLKKNRFPEHGI